MINSINMELQLINNNAIIEERFFIYTRYDGKHQVIRTQLEYIFRVC